MNTHTEHVLGQIQEVLDRARLRDARRMRAHKLALAVALIAPEVLADPETDEDHKAKIRAILAECRWIATNGYPLTVDSVFGDLPVDDVLRVVREEAQEEIDAVAAWDSKGGET